MLTACGIVLNLPPPQSAQAVNFNNLLAPRQRSQLASDTNPNTPVMTKQLITSDNPKAIPSQNFNSSVAIGTLMIATKHPERES